MGAGSLVRGNIAEQDQNAIDGRDDGEDAEFGANKEGALSSSLQILERQGGEVPSCALHEQNARLRCYLYLSFMNSPIDW